MSLQIASLNSGSNGNCYYIGNDDEALLVDAGLSCRETEKRMRSLGLSISNVKAILVSHEHGDHIKGVPVIAQRYDLPVYMSSDTWLGGATGVPRNQVRPLNSLERVELGGLSFIGFPKLHDAADPHSFIVSGNGVNIGVFTDIGQPCANVRKYFSLCHAAFLETNYDEVLLENGRYPVHLKNRIRGSKGHLSNHQALELFLRYKPAFMSHLLFAHLSKDNNDPALVMELFSPHAGRMHISVASRYECSPLFNITAGEEFADLEQVKKTIRPKQLALFGHS